MFLKYNSFGIGWGLLIFFLSIIPTDVEGQFLFFGSIPADKVLHVFNYMVLVYLFLIGFTKQYTFPLLNYYPVLSSVVAAMVYGMVIEAVQGALVPDRSFELADIFANFTGCLIGTALFTLVYFKI